MFASVCVCVCVCVRLPSTGKGKASSQLLYSPTLLASSEESALHNVWHPSTSTLNLIQTRSAKSCHYFKICCCINTNLHYRVCPLHTKCSSFSGQMWSISMNLGTMLMLINLFFRESYKFKIYNCLSLYAILSYPQLLWANPAHLSTSPGHQ